MQPKVMKIPTCRILAPVTVSWQTETTKRLAWESFIKTWMEKKNIGVAHYVM